MRIVLHIGPHKTGTTSIQTHLGALLREPVPGGYWYPAPGGNGPGHADLAWMCLREASPVAEFDRVIAAARAAQVGTLVLSSENFANAFPMRLDRLKNLLEGYQIHLVVSLNEFERRAASIWQETVKQGSVDGLEEGFEQILAGESTMQPHLTRVFVDALAPHQTSVVLSHHRAPAAELLTNVCQAIGLFEAVPGSEMVTRASTLHANDSLGLTETEILRSVNSWVLDAVERLNTIRYTEIRDLYLNLFNTPAWRSAIPLRPITVPASHAAEVHERGERELEDLKKLAHDGRIRIYGDVDSILRNSAEGLDQTRDRRGARPGSAVTRSPRSLEKSGVMTAVEVVKEARALIADERPDDARRVLSTFLLDQDDPNVWMVLSRVYHLLDDTVAARAILRNVVLEFKQPHIMNVIAAKIPYGKPLVIDELNLIYFYVPKCGSSSVKDALLLANGQELRGEMSHFHAERFERVVPFNEVRHRYSKYKTLLVVRHPRDRLRSYFARNISQDKSLREESCGKDVYYGLNTAPRYLDVLRNFQRYRNVFNDFRHHTDSIVGYVGMDTSILDYVFDLPEVGEAVSLIQTLSGVSMPTIHNMQSKEYPMELDAEARACEDEIMMSFYREEIELFFDNHSGVR